jgi:predicted nucleic acid-binding protein
MKVVDANLLIYAVNKDFVCHVAAKRWLGKAMSSDEPVGLAWLVLPTTRILSPLSDHREILKELLRPLGTAGNHTSDAHPAALAIEHKGVRYSTDNDFSRFGGLRWRDPLAL